MVYNTPALVPFIRMRSATSGQPSPPVGRPVNLAQHISTSPAASLMGTVGGINEIVASASNSKKRHIDITSEVICVHHNLKANYLTYTQGMQLLPRHLEVDCCALVVTIV